MAKDQFSDGCLYTTYRCRRNSEWLPWRLTTTHRSRQGNRKNIINKGTSIPRNKRNLNVPLFVPCELKEKPDSSSATDREEEEEEKEEKRENGKGMLAVDAQTISLSKKKIFFWCSREQKTC